jgi:L-2-hydroxyglutarate oxidase
MSNQIYDIAIIGGGIVGAASGMILSQKDFSVIILEAEENLASHQTGNNSGVIHSGIYYKPGSLKARNCVEGRELLYKFCSENDIKNEKCGKIIVAMNENETPILDEIERRGITNGLRGLRKLSKKEIKEFEYYVTGIKGLFVPDTGIVDYINVTNKFASKIVENGGEVKTNCRFVSIKIFQEELLLETTSGDIKCKLLINCGGLQSDRVAKKCGINPGLQIIPFRGEYYKLKPEKEYLVKNLVYPVPDPKFPFLGVHFTRMINGGIEAGPNAVLAFKREGYFKKDFSFRDVKEMITYSGFWKMAGRYHKTGFGEFIRSFSKTRFVKALQKLIPEIDSDDIYPAGAGVRAQAVDPDGNLLDDFRIIETKNMIHVLNAPSPAATASLSIGRTISEKAIEKLRK